MTGSKRSVVHLVACLAVATTLLLSNQSVLAQCRTDGEAYPFHGYSLIDITTPWTEKGDVVSLAYNTRIVAADDSSSFIETDEGINLIGRSFRVIRIEKSYAPTLLVEIPDKKKPVTLMECVMDSSIVVSDNSTMYISCEVVSADKAALKKAGLPDHVVDSAEKGEITIEVKWGGPQSVQIFPVEPMKPQKAKATK